LNLKLYVNGKSLLVLAYVESELGSFRYLSKYSIRPISGVLGKADYSGLIRDYTTDIAPLHDSHGSVPWSFPATNNT
jgi:hypothetical protein